MTIPAVAIAAAPGPRPESATEPVSGTITGSAPATGRPIVARPRLHVLQVMLMRAVAWLPEGRALPEVVWTRRHRWISRFALTQAFAIGLYAFARGFSATTCLIDVAICGVPAAMGFNETVGRRMRTISATVSLMFASATIVDVSGGVTEAHFHFFVMLGVVALYQDWVAFGVCIVITVVQHSVMGFLDPHSVYGSPDEWRHPIEWALIHGGFVLAASTTHLIAWKANEQQELSDPLTRLPNRTAFVEALDRRLGDPLRTVSVLFVDLDNFKGINDSGGHHVGDEALRHAARRMSNCVREGDMVARIGGDEFAVLVRGSAEHASVVAQRISAQLQSPIMVDGRELFIHASIGVADTEVAGSRDYADLLRHADLAMYMAKSSGKNQVTVYTAGIDTIVHERAALTVDLGSALTAGQLEVHYQPLMRSNGAELDGVEALLRWHHPTKGSIPPSDFIPLAEESGQIVTIGTWVLESATRQVARWRALPGCANLRASVNISPMQLLQPDFLEIITGALRRSSLPPSGLTLEVTETTLLQDLDLARRQLDAIRALGVRVSIDDFGTRYSSLSYLARLPADEVKIDQSFVRNLAHGAGPVALVRGIIEMARALHLDVLAEGVEMAIQQDILIDLGCPKFQGYLYSRPLPPAELEQAVMTGHLVRARVAGEAS